MLHYDQVGSISEIQGWFNNKESVKIFKVYEKINKENLFILIKAKRKLGE